MFLIEARSEARELIATLEALSFRGTLHIDDPYAQDARAYAFGLDPRMYALVGVAQDGSVDLDRVYELATQIQQGQFARLLSVAQSDGTLNRCGFLFYDISRPFPCERREEPTVKTLLRAVELETGGCSPYGSVFFECLEP
jgi:hypothetical protein